MHYGTKQTSPKTRHYRPSTGYAYQDRGKSRRVRRTLSLPYSRLCLQWRGNSSPGISVTTVGTAAAQTGATISEGKGKIT